MLSGIEIFKKIVNSYFVCIFEEFPGFFQDIFIIFFFPGLEINFFILQAFQGVWEPCTSNFCRGWGRVKKQ